MHLRPPDLTFTVPGRPRTKGSMRAIRPGVMIEGNKYSSAWRQIARLEATNACRGRPPFPEKAAYIVRMTCLFKRPLCHYRRDGRLKPTAPALCAVRIGDVEKIARNLYDAMEGVVWRDDAQIVESRTCKAWAPNGREYSRVEVWCLSGESAETFDVTTCAWGEGGVGSPLGEKTAKPPAGKIADHDSLY